LFFNRLKIFSVTPRARGLFACFKKSILKPVLNLFSVAVNPPIMQDVGFTCGVSKTKMWGFKNKDVGFQKQRCGVSKTKMWGFKKQRCGHNLTMPLCNVIFEKK